MCFQGDRPESHEREVVATTLGMDHETSCWSVYQGSQARRKKAEVELQEDGLIRQVVEAGGIFGAPERPRWASERRRPRLLAVRDEGPWMLDMQLKPQTNRLDASQEPAYEPAISKTSTD